MTVACFGLNHQSAPLSLLEKVSLSPDQMQEFLHRVREEHLIEEIAGLSTCNRTEFYFVAEDPFAAQAALVRHMEDDRQTRLQTDIKAHSYMHRNEVAASHLFRVAAGVDSMIVGEAQILGQLRKAYETALGVGCMGGLLNTLLMRAITFGRKVRVETNIGRGNVSVASVAHRIALKEVPDLKTKTLLVLGAGETAQIAARHFADEGVGDLLILNRTQEHSRRMAEELGGKSLPIDRLETGIEIADVIVCAVGAPHYIMTAAGMEDVMARRDDRPLLLIDLSMPRNIDPECGKIDGVKLFALENLEAIVSENRAQREQEIVRVESLVETETLNFVRWTQASETGRLITTMRRRCEEVRQKHIDRYCRDMSDEQRREIMVFSDSLLRSVLHDVTSNIRSIDLQSETGLLEYALVAKLFNLSTNATDKT